MSQIYTRKKLQKTPYYSTRFILVLISLLSQIYTRKKTQKSSQLLNKVKFSLISPFYTRKKFKKIHNYSTKFNLV